MGVGGTVLQAAVSGWRQASQRSYTANQSGSPVRGPTSFCILTFSLCVFAPAALLAQTPDPEKGEVSAFGAGSFGLGAHPVVGGGSGLAFSNDGLAMIEPSFLPLRRDTLRRNVASPQDSQ